MPTITHSAQLDPQAIASLNEAGVTLQYTNGFMYLPIFVESENAASLALAQLRTAMFDEPYRVAWPALRPATLSGKQQQIELEQDKQQLLTHFDEAIRKLPANAVLVLDASSGARSALALCIVTHLNLWREPLRAAQIRFVLLWFAPLREALMAGAPDLWSMRSSSPWVDEIETTRPQADETDGYAQRVEHDTSK